MDSTLPHSKSFTNLGRSDSYKRAKSSSNLGHDPLAGPPRRGMQAYQSMPRLSKAGRGATDQSENEDEVDKEKATQSLGRARAGSAGAAAAKGEDPCKVM